MFAAAQALALKRQASVFSHSEMIRAVSARRVPLVDVPLVGVPLTITRCRHIGVPSALRPSSCLLISGVGEGRVGGR